MSDSNRDNPDAIYSVDPEPGRVFEPPGADGIRTGMSFESLDEVQRELDLTQEDLEQALGVSSRTLQRRRMQGKALSSVTSDRLWRILHAYNLAHRALGSKKAARSWLKAPHAVLNDESPLARLDTEPGLREVEDMLSVIDETSAA